MERREFRIQAREIKGRGTRLRALSDEPTEICIGEILVPYGFPNRHKAIKRERAWLEERIRLYLDYHYSAEASYEEAES